MRLRLIIATADGQPITALDSAHADGHAQRWVDANLAQLAAQGIDAVAVEFDPVAGYSDTLDDLTALPDVRLEVRAEPTGARQIIGIHRYVGGKKASARAVARAIRVLRAPDDFTNTRATLRPQGGKS